MKANQQTDRSLAEEIDNPLKRLTGIGSPFTRRTQIYAPKVVPIISEWRRDLNGQRYVVSP